MPQDGGNKLDNHDGSKDPQDDLRWNPMHLSCEVILIDIGMSGLI